MPYEPTTYRTERVSLIGGPEQRTGANFNKDQRFINFFPEKLVGPAGQHFFLNQRAGLVHNRTTVAGTARGIHYWNGSTFYVIGNTLYRDGASIQTLSTSTGKVGFHDYAGLLKYLIVLDGTSGWIINTSFVVSQITDPDFPTPHSVHAAYLDGYMFVAKSGTDDIYNCVLEDPTSWNAGDFITAEMYPDTIVALTRQNNYILAIGEKSVEYFYDTGVAPGTPLARNSAGLHQMGTPAADSVVQIEEQPIFVGQTETGGRTVWLFNGFDPREIASEPVRRSLDAEGTNISNAKAFAVRVQGHKFYVLNLTSVTWVYDLEMQLWHNWCDYTGASKFQCDYSTDTGTGRPVMQDRSAGLNYTMTEGVSTDATSSSASTNITSIVITGKLDFNTMNGKFMHRLTIIGDVPAASSATSCTLSWSDDDYQTWTTPRTIVFDDTMPTITQLGRFRRRAFKLTYSQAYPLRVEGFEVDINTGSQ